MVKFITNANGANKCKWCHLEYIQLQAAQWQRMPKFGLGGLFATKKVTPRTQWQGDLLCLWQYFYQQRYRQKSKNDNKISGYNWIYFVSTEHTKQRNINQVLKICNGGQFAMVKETKVANFCVGGSQDCAFFMAGTINRHNSLKLVFKEWFKSIYSPFYATNNKWWLLRSV